MIRIDKQVAKAALKLTHNYNDEIHYHPGDNRFELVKRVNDEIRSVKLKPDIQDIAPSIHRLIASGHFKKTAPIWGEYYFSITPVLLHRFAFLRDDFTKKFWAGFFSGVATTIGTLLITYLAGLWQMPPR